MNRWAGNHKTILCFGVNRIRQGVGLYPSMRVGISKSRWCTCVISSQWCVSPRSFWSAQSQNGREIQIFFFPGSQREKKRWTYVFELTSNGVWGCCFASTKKICICSLWVHSRGFQPGREFKHDVLRLFILLETSAKFSQVSCLSAESAFEGYAKII